MYAKLTLKAVVIPILAVTLALGLFAMAQPAFAGGGGGHGGGGSTTVNNNNNAGVLNFVGAGANTGGNVADGGSGGAGDNGGKTGSADGGNGRRGGNGGSTGNADGGDGGTGGDGGVIFTGDAYAGAAALTVANSNDTTISNCGCGGRRGNTTVRNDNNAHVGNFVGAGANTGENDANGGDGRNGANGGTTGDADGGDGGGGHGRHGNRGGGGDGGDTGNANGGDGGDGGWGGLIDTGDAYAGAAAVNVLNKNVTRVRG